MTGFGEHGVYTKFYAHSIARVTKMEIVLWKSKIKYESLVKRRAPREKTLCTHVSTAGVQKVKYVRRPIFLHDIHCTALCANRKTVHLNTQIVT